jgi:Mg-chelatase subunit ChlI
MKRVFKTRLVGREEVFKCLALGELLQLPLLLTGPPGTGKSQAMTDYVGNKDDVFIVELDTGSKASEVKGFIDMKSLLEDKVYKTHSRIAEKDAILINEVEKGSSEIRNTLLSVMQEKELQLGSEGVKKCKWKLFAASCNSIPNDEIKEPFWDRFLIKATVQPLSIEDMKIARQGIEYTVEIDIPDVLPTISQSMMDKFDASIYSLLSDRQRIFANKLAAGIKAIWKLDDYQAICKLSTFLCPSQTASIAANIIPQEIVEIKTLITNIDNTVDYDAKSQMFTQLVAKFTAYNKKRDRDKELIDLLIKKDMIRISDEIETELKRVEKNKKDELSKQKAELIANENQPAEQLI